MRENVKTTALIYSINATVPQIEEAAKKVQNYFGVKNSKVHIDDEAIGVEIFGDIEEEDVPKINELIDNKNINVLYLIGTEEQLSNIHDGIVRL